MKRLTIVALGALALGGCAGSKIKPAGVCDGKHRRPANLYGTILPSLPVPLPASQQGAGQSLVAPPSRSTDRAPVPDRGPGAAPASDGSAIEAPVGPGAMDTQQPAPRLSQRDPALSYISC